jgi:hypothetical protein
LLLHSITTVMNKCYSNTNNPPAWTNTYNMTTTRNSRPAAALLSPTTWAITGGTFAGSNLPSVEAFIVGEGFSTVPISIPGGYSDHNLFLVDSSHIILLGGMDSTAVAAEAVSMKEQHELQQQ